MFFAKNEFQIHVRDKGKQCFSLGKSRNQPKFIIISSGLILQESWSLCLEMLSDQNFARRGALGFLGFPLLPFVLKSGQQRLPNVLCSSVSQPRRRSLSYHLSCTPATKKKREPSGLLILVSGSHETVTMAVQNRLHCRQVTLRSGGDLYSVSDIKLSSPSLCQIYFFLSVHTSCIGSSCLKACSK